MVEIEAIHLGAHQVIVHLLINGPVSDVHGSQTLAHPVEMLTLARHRWDGVIGQSSIGRRCPDTAKLKKQFEQVAIVGHTHRPRTPCRRFYRAIAGNTNRAYQHGNEHNPSVFLHLVDPPRRLVALFVLTNRSSPLQQALWREHRIEVRCTCIGDSSQYNGLFRYLLD